MLDAVRGTVESTEDGVLLLDIGSLTLELLVPGYFLPDLQMGESVRVFTHFQLSSEGNRILPLAVAFPCVSDRTFFRSFISVSGVGVRAAARALCHPPRDVAAAISRGDLAFLKALPGIGATRAKQIIAKLQEVMAATAPDFKGDDTCRGSRTEVLLVLKQLGIPGDQAALLVSRAVLETGDSAGTQDILRACMRMRIRSGSAG
ncbi:MAG: Holliday junction branch migration protein RuvA [Candidatus Fermentibacteraceae bacterium]